MKFPFDLKSPVEIHWEEGMFMRPHHFQLAHRSLMNLNSMRLERARPWNYGVIHLDVNHSALPQHLFEIQSCEAALQNGQWISIPGNAKISEKSFENAMKALVSSTIPFSEKGITVYLGVPKMNEAKRNVIDYDDSTDTKGIRFTIDTERVFDENTGRQQPQEIKIRSLNACILFDNENLSDYDTLPIARILPPGHGQPYPSIDKDFIPPILAVSDETWPSLYRMVKKIK